MTGARLLALDPSLTGTGWVVVDCESGSVIAAGVIRTAKAPKTERLTAAEDAARRGVAIRRGVAEAIEAWSPALVVQEGNAGSRTAQVAGALARAQQACVDAVDGAMGGLPMIVTPQSVKQATVGSLKATKDDMKRAAEERWGIGLVDACNATGLPRGALENAYDAACVAASVWDSPAVTLLRAHR